MIFGFTLTGLQSKQCCRHFGQLLGLRAQLLSLHLKPLIACLLCVDAAGHLGTQLGSQGQGLGRRLPVIQSGGAATQQASYQQAGQTTS
jgi:hypothetical protein